MARPDLSGGICVAGFGVAASPGVGVLGDAWAASGLWSPPRHSTDTRASPDERCSRLTMPLSYKPLRDARPYARITQQSVSLLVLRRRAMCPAVAPDSYAALGGAWPGQR